MEEQDDQVKMIIERLAKFRASEPSNEPDGLPDGVRNTDETDPDYPTQHNLPRDHGWNSADLVSGSGHGPKL